MFVLLFVCLFVCLFLCMYVCMYVCMCVRACVRVCVCLHILTFMSSALVLLMESEMPTGLHARLKKKKQVAMATKGADVGVMSVIK